MKIDRWHVIATAVSFAPFIVYNSMSEGMWVMFILFMTLGPIGFATHEKGKP